ncbi:MAG TPA: dethiobiotin synthase [Pseudobacteroides sp.]|uniref:dethiobiotin synthase n=1 Tax=Pseudobacteroides sp. TaxID=1968840 RepID=UPI002F920A41
MKKFKGLFVIGTGTDVGKTVVCAGLMYLLRSKGYNACYFKPVSSGGANAPSGFASYDVSFVKEASVFDEADDRINPYRYKSPVSPHLASKKEDRPIEKQIILNRYKELIKDYDYIIVEGCGGLAVPLSDEGYMQYQLIKELGTGCILVAKTSLGTINHTLLTLAFAKNTGIPVEGIVFSGFQGSLMEQNNIDTISKLTDVPVIGVVPRIKGIDVENKCLGELRPVFEKTIHIEKMVANV